jgi:hypothetical protein
LVLISLISAILSAVLSPLIYSAVVGGLYSDPSNARWWITIVIPGITLALAGALGLTGVAGVVTIEWNRGRTSDRPPRAWDRPRVAAAVSLVAAAILFGSGVVLGFVYVEAFQIVAAVRAGLWVIFALSAGLFLFWTAERMNPGATRLRHVGLVLGAASATLAQATMAASLLGWLPLDPVIGELLGLTVSSIGTLSLLAWIVVYSGILARRRPVGGASTVSS